MNAPTPEQTRDRILAAIDVILFDGYLAPEVKRSRLYALLLDELDTFARFHGDALGHVSAMLGLQPGTPWCVVQDTLRRRLA